MFAVDMAAQKTKNLVKNKLHQKDYWVMNKAVIASILKVLYDSITINSQYNLGEGKSI